MAVETLFEVQLVGLQRDKRIVLDFLQEAGILHIKQKEEINNKHSLNVYSLK